MNSDPVERTRKQLTADILRTNRELESACLRRDDDEIAELQSQRRYLKDQLASLDSCFS